MMRTFMIISLFLPILICQSQSINDYHKNFMDRFKNELTSLFPPSISLTPASSHALSLFSSSSSSSRPLSLSFSPNEPPFDAVVLFTPNVREQPAETKGQIEEFLKDLQEQHKEREMERNANKVDYYNDVEESDGKDNDDLFLKGNYVSVKSSHYNYSYFS